MLPNFFRIASAENSQWNAIHLDLLMNLWPPLRQCSALAPKATKMCWNDAYKNFCTPCVIESTTFYCVTAKPCQLRWMVECACHHGKLSLSYSFDYSIESSLICRAYSSSFKFVVCFYFINSYYFFKTIFSQHSSCQFYCLLSWYIL